MRASYCVCADARASGRGFHCRQGRERRLAANMGTVVKFPDEGRIVRFVRVDGEEDPAQIIILPVVRIERHPESQSADVEPHTHPPTANGGRRRVRRR